MAICTMATAFFLILLDSLEASRLGWIDQWIYAFGAESARAILSAIAGSMITVAGHILDDDAEPATGIFTVWPPNAAQFHARPRVQAAERTVGDEGTDGPGLVLSYTRWLWARMDHDLGAAPSVLFVGGGGYTLPTKLLVSRPAARAVAVEIDPLATRVVRQHMPRAGKMIEQTGYGAASSEQGAEGRLGIVHADGRVYLNETERRFDAAVMDAFSSSSVPAHLVTLETYERLRAIVDGPVYVNLIDAPDGRLARGVHAILSDLYPHIQVMQGPMSSRGRANIVLAASPTPLAGLDTLPEGYEPVEISPARAFTDDRGWVGYRYDPERQFDGEGEGPPIPARVIDGRDAPEVAASVAPPPSPVLGRRAAWDCGTRSS